MRKKTVQLFCFEFEQKCIQIALTKSNCNKHKDTEITTKPNSSYVYFFDRIRLHHKNFDKIMCYANLSGKQTGYGLTFNYKDPACTNVLNMIWSHL